MESWEGYNYYTRNNTRWVELMNRSTTEWNIGSLPSNLVAIPGTLNSSYHFSADAIIIEKASKADIGSRGIEKVVFGVTSGLVLLWAVAFLYYNHKTMLSPRGSSVIPRANSPLSNTPTITGDGDGEGVTDKQFRTQLANFYYPPTKSELEESEKNVATEQITSEDVEAVTDLLRKMYDLDLGLWSQRNSTHVSEVERQAYRDKSDAVLAEIRRIVTSWNDQRSRGEWNPDEAMELDVITQYLMQRLPEKRYKSQI